MHPHTPAPFYRFRLNARSMVYSAMCLALCLVLPFLVGQIPTLGKMLSPMHLPVLLCGFLCGWPWGLVVGFVAPLLRSLLFQMPVMFPGAISMAFELATYGALSGLLYRAFRKTVPGLWGALILSMIAGRCVWGVVRFLLAGLSHTDFPFSAFWAGAVGNAIPGIILQLILVPALVLALRAAKLAPKD